MATQWLLYTEPTALALAALALALTPGRSGIGYSIAEEMMRFGANACILGRDAKGLAESAAALEKSTGSKCLAAPSDVRSKEDLAKAVKACLDKFGRIDFVVCGESRVEQGRGDE